MKKISKIVVLCTVILSLCLCLVLTACNNNKVTGKYFLEKSDGTLNEESWIELSGKSWNDDEGETGTYEIKGDVIIFSQDGEEIIEGTLVDGVLTIWDSVL